MSGYAVLCVFLIINFTRRVQHENLSFKLPHSRTDIRAKAECATYEYTNANGDLVTLKNYVIVGDASIPN